jgi:hypothetical protein
MLSQRWVAAWAAIFAICVGPAPALSAAKAPVFNKEHVWAIDVDDGACALSRTLPGGGAFLFRAKNGQLTFGFFPKTPLQKGRTARIETEGYGFDFAPSYGDHGETLFLNRDLDARAVSALRRAREVRVLTDGRLVMAMTFERTGFGSALDGVIACSQGAGGWWGKGVGPQPTDTGPRADLLTDFPVLNKEGDWALARGGEPGRLCR